MEGVNLQPLLDLGAALLRSDDAISDRWQRSVPKPLPRILAHRAKHMLGGLLRLIFVEQCHNLAHHDMHGIRSEEHTSELQSLMRISYAVFCLKKKNKRIT